MNEKHTSTQLLPKRRPSTWSRALQVGSMASTTIPCSSAAIADLCSRLTSSSLPHGPEMIVSDLNAELSGGGKKICSNTAGPLSKENGWGKALLSCR